MGKDDAIIKPEDIVSAALLGGSLSPGSRIAMPAPAQIAVPAGPRIMAPTPDMIAALAGLRNIELLPQPTQARWGSPMGEWTKNESQAPERPDTDPGWGRAETLLANAVPQEMARVILPVSIDMEVSIDTIVAPGVATLASGALVPLVVWAVVTFGNGSTSVSRKIQCADRFDVPVCGTFCQVTAYIGDLQGNDLTGKQFSPTQPLSPTQPIPSANVSVMVSRSIRGTPYVAPSFAAAFGPSGSLFTSQFRALNVMAHLTAQVGGNDFLQLFDQSARTPPPNGTVPTTEFALGTLPSPGIDHRWLNPRGFSQGCFYCVSSTAGTLTLSGDSAWVEVEKMQL